MDCFVFSLCCIITYIHNIIKIIVVGFLSHSGVSDMTIWHFATAPPLMSIFNCDIISSLKHKNGTRNSYIPFNQTYFAQFFHCRNMKYVYKCTYTLHIIHIHIYSSFMLHVIIKYKVKTRHENSLSGQNQLYYISKS